MKLSDGRAVSVKGTDGGAPSWCEDLGFWEYPNLTESFYSMGFHSLEFAYFDCCWSGRLMINSHNELVEGQPGAIGQAYDEIRSDMSWALGMQESSRSRVYQGWYSDPKVAFPPYETDHQKWTRNEWDALGAGDNLEMAIMYANAVTQQTNPEDPNAPINDFRLKGQGLLQEIRLGN
jgi:hypothetical protein